MNAIPQPSTTQSIAEKLNSLATTEPKSVEALLGIEISDISSFYNELLLSCAGMPLEFELSPHFDDALADPTYSTQASQKFLSGEQEILVRKVVSINDVMEKLSRISTIKKIPPDEKKALQMRRVMAEMATNITKELIEIDPTESFKHDFDTSFKGDQVNEIEHKYINFLHQLSHLIDRVIRTEFKGSEKVYNHFRRPMLLTATRFLAIFNLAIQKKLSREKVQKWLFSDELRNFFEKDLNNSSGILAHFYQLFYEETEALPNFTVPLFFDSRESSLPFLRLDPNKFEFRFTESDCRLLIIDYPDLHVKIESVIKIHSGLVHDGCPARFGGFEGQKTGMHFYDLLAKLVDQYLLPQLAKNP